MNEYILEFGDALYNEETGEAVFKPKYKGELIRCWKCKHYNDGVCAWHRGDGYAWVVDGDTDYCSVGERKEE